jgi:hypothetical protein
MWQLHDMIYTLRMEELRANAERESRWRLADQEQGRPARRPAPGPLRLAAARFAAALARSAGRAARWLDDGVDLGRERLARDRVS